MKPYHFAVVIQLLEDMSRPGIIAEVMYHWIGDLYWSLESLWCINGSQWNHENVPTYCNSSLKGICWCHLYLGKWCVFWCCAEELAGHQTAELRNFNFPSWQIFSTFFKIQHLLQHLNSLHFMLGSMILFSFATWIWILYFCIFNPSFEAVFMVFQCLKTISFHGRRRRNKFWWIPQLLPTNKLRSSGDNFIETHYALLEGRAVTGSQDFLGRANQEQSQVHQEEISGWWFEIFCILIPTWGSDPIWLIFFKWVGSTTKLDLIERTSAYSYTLEV